MRLCAEMALRTRFEKFFKFFDEFILYKKPAYCGSLASRAIEKPDIAEFFALSC